MNTRRLTNTERKLLQTAFIAILIPLISGLLGSSYGELATITGYRNITLLVSLPLFLIICWAAYLEFQGKPQKISYQYLFLILSLAVFAPLVVSAINAQFGKKQPIPVQGKIVDLVQTKDRVSKSFSYTIKIKPDHNSAFIELKIPKEESKKYQLGSHYSEIWFKGSLGFLYK